MTLFPLSLPLAASEGFAIGGVSAVLIALAGLATLLAVLALSNEEGRAFTGAIVYLGLGVVAAILLPALGLDLYDPVADPVPLEHLSEIAVVIALFATGLQLDRPFGSARWRTPAVLLLVVMPLTIAAVAAWGALAMGLSLGAAIVLGGVLAPTDPVLAEEVAVGPPGEGDEPEATFALTAEAGGNDGLAFPFVFLGVTLAASGAGGLGEWFAADVLYAIPVGLGLGALTGVLASRVVRRMRARRVVEADFDGWIAVGVVLVAYGLTELAGAYGFLAAFAAGLAFRRDDRADTVHGRAHAGVGHVTQVAELLLVLLLGTFVTFSAMSEPGVAGWLLVPLLLLVIRPLAVAVALAPARLRREHVVFIGWFGIRGIGSLYYAAVALGSGALAAEEGRVVFWTAVACAAVSILVHGLTASRLTRRLVHVPQRGAEGEQR